MRHVKLNDEQAEQLRRHVGDSVRRDPIAEGGSPEMLPVERPQAEQHQRRVSAGRPEGDGVADQRQDLGEGRRPAGNSQAKAGNRATGDEQGQ